VSRQLEVREGRIQLPQGPGLGFDFNDAAVQRYALAPWRG
jgi:L-alanine-DL-glutamate epimerase-like enolase superfamily enzyme